MQAAGKAQRTYRRYRKTKLGQAGSGNVATSGRSPPRGKTGARQRRGLGLSCPAFPDRRFAVDSRGCLPFGYSSKTSRAAAGLADAEFLQDLSVFRRRVVATPGGPGEFHPRAPTERSVKVSLHSARLIHSLVRTRPSRLSGRTCAAAFRSARATMCWLWGKHTNGFLSGRSEAPQSPLSARDPLAGPGGSPGNEPAPRGLPKGARRRSIRRHGPRRSP
jgi:hypothetical protein